MVGNNGSTTDVYLPYVEERAKHFTAREWVFAALVEWALPVGPRCFLLTGEPGSGKTAIASRIVQLNGSPSPSELRGLLSGYHFCSAGDLAWINPHVFISRLARQLAAHFPRYGKALLETAGDRAIHITVNQHVEGAAGPVSGVIIGHLDASGITPEDAWLRLVREPLEQLCHDTDPGPIVILVDALDEALAYSGRTNIATLLLNINVLPPQARLIVTLRPDSTLLRGFERISARRCSLSDQTGTTRSKEDVRAYVTRFAIEHPDLEARLVGVTAPELASLIAERSEGNFLYLRYSLDNLLGNHTITRQTISSMPAGLDRVYLDFLARTAGAVGRDWEARLAPILGTLAVTQEPVSEGQLAFLSGLERGVVRRSLTALRSFLDTDESLPPSGRRYTLYHRSFAELLLDADRAAEYWCSAREQHARIVAAYRGTAPEWSAVEWEHVDDYGLRHIVLHACGAGSPVRKGLSQLLGTPFRTAKEKRFWSELDFVRDLDVAIEYAERDGAQALPHVIVWRLVQSTLKEQIQSTPLALLLFLASAGAEDEAFHRISALPPAQAAVGLADLARLRIGRAENAESARELIHSVINLMGSLTEDSERITVLEAALNATDRDPDQTSRHHLTLAALDAASGISDRQCYASALARCATSFARANSEAALPTLAEAEDVMQLLDRVSHVKLLIATADAWRTLLPETAHALLERALDRADADEPGTERYQFGRIRILALRGDITAAASELHGVADGLLWRSVAELIDNAEAFETLWSATAAIKNGTVRLWVQGAIAVGMARCGLAERALEAARDVERRAMQEATANFVLVATEEQLIAIDAFWGIADLISVRTKVALLPERGLESSKADLDEALSLLDARAIRIRALSMDITIDHPGADALTEMAEAIMRVGIGDASWAALRLQRLFEQMKEHRTMSQFSGNDLQEWHVRAHVVVAAGLARLGREDKAKELFDHALTIVARMPPGKVREGAASVAGIYASNVDDPAWLDRILRSLLTLARVSRTGRDEAIALVRLVANMPTWASNERRSAVETRIESFVSRIAATQRGDHSDPSSDDWIGELDAIAELLPTVEDTEAVTAAFRRLAPFLGDVSVKKGTFVTSFFENWALIDVAAARAWTNQLPDALRPYAWLGIGRADDDYRNRATALDSALALAGEMDHVEVPVITAIVEDIPADAGSPEVARWIQEAVRIAGVKDELTPAADLSLSTPSAAPSGESPSSDVMDLIGAVGRIAARRSMDDLLRGAIDWLQQWGAVEGEEDRRPYREALAGIAASVADHKDLVEPWVERINRGAASDVTRAAIASHVGNRLFDQGRTDEAARYYGAALELASPNSESALFGLQFDLVSALVRLDRTTDAIDLVSTISNPARKNDAYDLIATELVRRGSLEAAADVLARMTPFDTITLLDDGDVRLREGVAALADNALQHGDFESAVSWLRDPNDLWALPAVAHGRCELGDQLVRDGVPSDRVGRLAFEAFRTASNQSDVLCWIAGFAPALRLVHEDCPVELWRLLNRFWRLAATDRGVVVD